MNITDPAYLLTLRKAQIAWVEDEDSTYTNLYEYLRKNWYETELAEHKANAFCKVLFLLLLMDGRL